MKASKLTILALVILAGIAACKKEDPQLGDVPTPADAEFTYTESEESANILEFSLVNTSLRAVWDLGNGQKAEGITATGTYPNAGTYTVSVTVFASGGSATSTQDIVIAQDDNSLLEGAVFTFLTGGEAGGGSKVWVIDSLVPAHFGVGPDPIGAAGYWPEWWAANPLDKAGTGLYDDRYEFHLSGFQFDMHVNGDVYVHNGLAGDFPDSYENSTDYTAPYTDQLGENWVLTTEEDTTITVTGNSHIGMYTGPREYRVVLLNDTALHLQYKHYDGGLHWYLRLVPEGFVSYNVSEGPQSWDLPLDFETVEPTFTTFGNSTYGVSVNPDQSGINTSAMCMQTVHGNESWSGLYVDLNEPLDFTSTPNIALKMHAPIADSLRIKIENSANPDDFVELDVVGTSANTWEQFSVDFSGAASGVYDRLVLFPGWGQPNSGAFYIDDIEQE